MKENLLYLTRNVKLKNVCYIATIVTILIATILKLFFKQISIDIIFPIVGIIIFFIGVFYVFINTLGEYDDEIIKESNVLILVLEKDEFVINSLIMTAIVAYSTFFTWICYKINPLLFCFRYLVFYC